MRTLRSLQSAKRLKLIIALVIPSIILILPTSVFPFDGLTIIQQRVIALFFLAALFWVLEPIPIFATSVLLITLELLLLSDSGLSWLQHPADASFGNMLSYKEIMATFASPVILLFLGGFFLAEAASKYRLDQNIAGLLLPKFGKNPKIVLLGLMSLSAAFSMFMSNTATTAMMLAIIIPLLKTFPAEDKSKIAFILGIPFAANLGGLGTPIGTPPNAIALKFLSDAHLTFGKWMAFGVPIVLVMLVLCWLLMIAFFPASSKEVNLSIKVDFLKTPKAKLVYLTFIITILLWLLDFAHGMNSYVVAMIPVCVFITTGVINKEDLKGISWDVLWLVSGGIALGLALEKTGLATLVIQSIPFDQFHPYAVFIFCSLIGLIMANFMSHTATANLLLPLMATIGTSIANMQQVGGSVYMVVATTFCISLGMSLPISSPPNALANATGLVQTKDMAKVGVLVGIIGWLLVLGMMIILYLIDFLS